jgi:hypothetical protein
VKLVRSWPGTLVVAVITACGSQIPTLRDWANQSVGRPVSELEAIDSRPESYAARTGWHRETYSLPNGNWVYVHPDRPHCDLHFEVNPAGVVVGYRAVGEGCRHQ